MADPNHPGKRIRWIVDRYYKGEYAKLASAIGAVPASFTRIFAGTSYPSWKLITAILAVHEEINPDWFLNGIGPRIRSVKKSKIALERQNRRLEVLLIELKDELSDI